MTIYKYFTTPKFHDAAFYKDRPVSDHIHEAGHRERLLRTLSDVQFVLDVDKECKSVSDLGCGNGGFLHELGQRSKLKAWGYDLSPLAVEDGVKRYVVDARCVDFTSETVEFGDVVVLTEVLEHLVDPVAMLAKIRASNARWVVASVPSSENEKYHYEYHLWAWTGDSFRKMFEKVGYTVVLHYATPLVSSQFLIARNA